jgi:hypothetical protein
MIKVVKKLLDGKINKRETKKYNFNKIINLYYTI